MSVTFKPDFLTYSEIEKESRKLLMEFSAHSNAEIAAPVPVEEILENHLKLSLEILDDMDDKLLGYYDAFYGTIAVNSAITPEEQYAGKAGRFNFTLGHEIGHHRLHRHLIFAGDAQAQLGMKIGQQNQRIVCRKSECKQPIETQANQFSACLLMPRKLLLLAWEKLMADCIPSRVMPTDESIISALSEDFAVSKQAMQIRLDALDLSVETYLSQTRMAL